MEDMRVIKKNLFALLAGALLVPTLSVANPTIVDDPFEIMVSSVQENGLHGRWGYTAESAPEQYRRGGLAIFEENGQNKVVVKFEEADVFGQNVKVSGSTIRFKFTYEGVTFDVELTVKGDTLNGTYTSTDGTFGIKADRLKVM
ncbi:hypothetical protein [Zobellia uliginosa]|uniref:hypothetical protein n=1 Tax=Zobellia uliginosa TaxID=143224 RepID=UPI0026E36642|nr:hypothetical protein [Zobellia uliginosa]MDO6517833.1 hypothetical protein [Zobellia uliginosa]